MTTVQENLVTIGKIERPFGVRGEFKVRSLSDVPGRLDQLKQVQVLEPTGQMVDRTVTHVRRAGVTYIMGLAGVTTPEEAGMLRGGLIQVPRRPAATLSADVYFECDLIGMTVEVLQKNFGGCFRTAGKVPVVGRSEMMTYALRDLPSCRDRHPDFVHSNLLVEGDK
ncbi:MAG: ribosome maturation factor RimM, partial [Nitrospirales bacterium]